MSQLAIPANGWYAPPDLNVIPKRFSSRQTRTDTAADSDAPAPPTASDEEQHVYTPPIFDAEVYASSPKRAISLPKESGGQIYTPPANLYDVPEFALTDSEEPDDGWLARFQG